jgi:hypothetical protein
MKNLIIILVVLSSLNLGCRKNLCSMLRYDIGYLYTVTKQDTMFDVRIWIDPHPLDTSLAQEILDSFKRLEQLGYKVRNTAAMRYSYADCDFCEQLNRKKPSAKATCYETE